MYQVSNLMCYHGLYWHINVQQQCNMITVIVTMFKKKVNSVNICMLKCDKYVFVCFFSHF